MLVNQWWWSEFIYSFSCRFKPIFCKMSLFFFLCPYNESQWDPMLSVKNITFCVLQKKQIWNDMRVEWFIYSTSDPLHFFSLSLLWGRRISKCSFLPPSPCLRSILFRSITSQSYLGCFSIMANMGLITEDTPAPRYKGASPKEGLQPLCAGGSLFAKRGERNPVKPLVQRCLTN